MSSKRPYFHYGIEELERLAVQTSDVATLRQIVEEMAPQNRPRQGPKLIALRRKVEARLRRPNDATDPVTTADHQDVFSSQEELFSADDSPRTNEAPERHSELQSDKESLTVGLIPDDRQCPAQFTLVRPTGTPGLPDAFVRPLRRDLTLDLAANADIPDRFIAALSALILEIKRTGAGQKKYELEKGHRAETAGSEILYQFPFTDEADIFEEAQIEILVSGRRIDGTVVSIGSGLLLLALKEDLGQEAASAVLLIDATALLDALRSKIEAVKKSEITLNRVLADPITRGGDFPSPPAEAILARATKLDPAQHRAYRRALEQAITFIWGPPGCGKTKTLGEIVRSAFESGKRVLICSNTNKAVDQVVYNVCETLGREHIAMQEGKVVRLGRIADDKLKDDYSEFVTVDGIAERRSAELKAEKQRIEEEIARTDARSASARRIASEFDLLEQAQRRLAEEQEVTNRIARNGKAAEEALSSNAARASELAVELEKRRTAFLGFLRRSEASIQSDIKQNATDRITWVSRVEAIRDQYRTARLQYEQALRDRDGQKSLVAGKDERAARDAVAHAEEERTRLLADLREVENKIAAIASSIIRDARILGATCTKCYLSQKDIGQADIVIIDEASMIPLPVAWFSAGLARERLVVSGDFRQIPPIVMTQQEAIFEILGRDPFVAANLANPAEPRLAMLDTQYRMHPHICDLISGPMYSNLLRTAGDRSPVPGRQPISPFDSPLTIIDTSELWPFESQNVFYSRYNLLHALLARNFAWKLQRTGIIEDNQDLGICTPYAAQAKIIQKLLEGEGLDDYVQASTVHRYQGDQRRIILLDILESHGGAWGLGQFVQGLPPEHIGARLINVAVSRAQEHLVVLANLTYLDKRLPSTSLLRGILYEMQQRGAVVPGREILKWRPIEHDLAGLVGQMSFSEIAESLGIFDEVDFEKGLAHDIQRAAKSIVLFSGYITPTRVGMLGDLLRTKIAEGVKVRCVTRPPKFNGSIPEPAGREAIEMLEGIGVVVDCRARIHQKVCLVDNEIVWWGSLNALSHMYHSDETMTRAVNEGFARMVAAHMSKRATSVAVAAASIAEAENPRCPECGGRTVFADGKYGPYFYCEAECGWSANARDNGRNGNSQTDTGKPKNGPPCPICGSATNLRKGRYGSFYGCVRYPECKGIAR